MELHELIQSIEDLDKTKSAKRNIKKVARSVFPDLLAALNEKGTFSAADVLKALNKAHDIYRDRRRVNRDRCNIATVILENVFPDVDPLPIIQESRRISGELNKGKKRKSRKKVEDGWNKEELLWWADLTKKSFFFQKQPEKGLRGYMRAWGLWLSFCRAHNHPYYEPNSEIFSRFVEEKKATCQVSSVDTYARKIIKVLDTAEFLKTAHEAPEFEEWDDKDGEEEFLDLSNVDTEEFVEFEEIISELDRMKRIQRALGRSHKKGPKIGSMEKIVDPKDVIRAAIQLFEKAENEDGRHRSLRAVDYRDGLLFLLLATRPLRISNIVDLVFGEAGTGAIMGPHLLECKKGYRVICPPQATKNKKLYETQMPEEVVIFVRRYVDHWRKYLLAGSQTNGPTAFFPSMRANNARTKMSGWGMAGRIGILTGKLLGVVKNPHSFRHDLAHKALAEEDWENLAYISQILGHVDINSIAPYIAAGVDLAAQKQLTKAIRKQGFPIR